MAIVSIDHATTSPTDNETAEARANVQPPRLERATLVASRRAESGSSPQACCKQQPTKQNNSKGKALTIMGAIKLLLVTVCAVRYVAGGLVQASRGSVTLAKTLDELRSRIHHTNTHTQTAGMHITFTHHQHLQPP